MKDRQETLGEFVRRTTKEKGLSYRQVERNAKQKGHQITHAVVGEVINNPDKTLQVDTLKALAVGLGVDYGLLASLASGESLDEELNKKLEREIKEIGRLLTEAAPADREYGLKMIETVKYDLRRRNQESSRKQVKGSNRKASLTAKFPIGEEDMITIPMTGRVNQDEEAPQKGEKAR